MVIKKGRKMHISNIITIVILLLIIDIQITIKNNCYNKIFHKQYCL